jgi:hypothetical protein
MTCLARVLLAVMLLPNVCLGDVDALVDGRLVYRETILGRRAPKGVERLVKDEQTVVTFVADLPEGKGKTNFFIDVDWKYNYNYKILQQGDARQLELTVIDLRLQFSERHVVQMPLAYHRADVWETQLLLHEFDHVALSGDQRIKLLLDEVCGNLPTITVKLAGDEKPDDAFLGERVNDEITRREKAVLNLVRANYLLLDKVSDHGRVPIPNREQFFAQLFTRANLQQHRFPYLEQVSKLLDSEAYRAVKLKHLKTDPAAR